MTMKITSDNNLNPSLAAQVQDVRGGLLEAAESKPIPPRFLTEQNEQSPSVCITDSLTGHNVDVPLFAYGAVREVLHRLFSAAVSDGGKSSSGEPAVYPLVSPAIFASEIGEEAEGIGVTLTPEEINAFGEKHMDALAAAMLGAGSEYLQKHIRETFKDRSGLR